MKVEAQGESPADRGLRLADVEAAVEAAVEAGGLGHWGGLTY